MDITNISPTLLALVPVVMGLVQVVKRLGLPTRFAPILSIAFGIAGAFVVAPATVGITIILGIIVGLTASGLYAGGKTTITSQE